MITNSYSQLSSLNFCSYNSQSIVLIDGLDQSSYIFVSVIVCVTSFQSRITLQVTGVSSVLIFVILFEYMSKFGNLSMVFTMYESFYSFTRYVTIICVSPISSTRASSILYSYIGIFFCYSMM